MKIWTIVLLACVLSGPLLFAQQPDPFQADIPPDLVAKVEDAKEKQVIGHDLETATKELRDVLARRPDYYRALSI